MMKAIAAAALAAALLHIAPAHAQDSRSGYTGASRTFLFSPTAQEFFDAKKFKKAPPYVIGFSNASISNIWRVGLLDSIEQGAADNKKLIKKLIITDAKDDPAKQVADIEDLVSRGVDILIVSAATSQALDPVITRVMRRGIPVVMVDRRITSDNFISFVTASDIALGRFTMQWLAETLGGKGNIVMLSGIAGASPAELRLEGAHEVLNSFPDIKVLDLQYTDWSPAKGKTVMASLIQKYGSKIDGVWSDHGLQGIGALEAYVDAGTAKGKFPPITCSDLNGCLKLAVQNQVPVMNYDFPPAMGAAAVRLALDVLAGRTVPRHVEVNAQIAVSKGHETASVHADRWVEDYVQMNKPNDLVLSAGLGPNYDPSTFSADYPK